MFYKLISIILVLMVNICFAEPNTTAKSNPAAIVRSAVAEGKIALKLTEPNELIALLGKPAEEKTENDGGMQILDLAWPGVSAMFGRMRETGRNFTLYRLAIDNKPLDIGERKIVLRNAGDLKKFDTFWGYAVRCSTNDGH
jgi:hypothetical protein